MKRTAVLLVLFGALTSLAAGPGRPKLAVLLVVDQLAEPEFARRLPKATGGFKRLVEEGFRFTDARYASAPPVTGEGHATLSTGAYPSVHGIVSNDWYDTKTHLETYVTDDPRCAPLSGRGRGPGVGPGQLRVPTFGDSLKAAAPASRVVAISGKDRSAVMMAGRTGTVALWVSDAQAQFTTSSCYGALPAWVDPVNARLRQALAAGLTWCPAHQPCVSAAAERPFQHDEAGFGPSWPHHVPKDAKPALQAEAVLLHPLMDALYVDLAIVAVKSLELGRREGPDLLAVSFSTFDEVAHVFGLDSLEADEVFTSTDQQIGRLLAALDESLGKGRYVVALSADHGGAAVPELARKQGVDAGRVDIRGLRAALEQVAEATSPVHPAFLGWAGIGFSVSAGAGPALHALNAKLRQVAQAADGVVDLLPREELVAGGGGEAGDILRRGFDPERSPDYFLLTKPGWVATRFNATTHGTVHLYDRQVPILFMGAGVLHGTGGRADPVDVAPTLGALLGVARAPTFQGKALPQVTGVEAP